MRQWRLTARVVRIEICAALVALGLATFGLAACGEITYDPSTAQFRVPFTSDGPRNGK